MKYIKKFWLFIVAGILAIICFIYSIFKKESTKESEPIPPIEVEDTLPQHKKELKTLLTQYREKTEDITKASKIKNRTKRLEELAKKVKHE